MTAARLTALQLLLEGPILEPGLCVYRIQQRVMLALWQDGLVKFRPYGKPPSWAITKAGRDALAANQ